MSQMKENKEKMVTIKLPRSKAPNDSEVFVSVNERTWVIKRGEAVEVPECVKEVLEHQEEMEEATFAYQESVAKDE